MKMFHFTIILICALAKRTELKKYRHDLEQEILNINRSRSGFYELYFKDKRFHTTFHPSKGNFRETIPESFDARERWPYCKTIADFYNTGQCVTIVGQIVVAVLTDRNCVKDQKQHFNYSLEDFLTCCEQCEEMIPPGGSICNELNYLIAGFKHWLSVGIVSGGEIDSNKGCKPYSDEFFYDGDSKRKCSLECSNYHYPIPYEEDRKRGNSLRVIISKNKHDIKYEIYHHGPVVSLFAVPEDFLDHEEGVYNRQFGGIIGYFPIKIIGWGRENSSNNFYWLIYFPKMLKEINKYGTFKISKYLHIEDMIFAPQIYEETHYTTTQVTTSSSTKQFIGRFTMASDLLVVFLLLSTLRRGQFFKFISC